MANTLQISQGLFTAGISDTQNIPIANIFGGNGSSTEANKQLTYRTGGTLKNLYVRTKSNANTGTTTIFTRKAAANANMNVSIGASVSGEFEDLVNTDTVTAADKWNYQFITGGTGGNIVFDGFGTTFSATTNTVVRHGCNGFTSAATASTTFFLPFTGRQDNTTTEANAQFKNKTGGTLKNFFVNITVDANTSTKTMGTRIAGGNGNLTVSIGSTATGIFEDTSNTDNLSVGNFVNYYLTIGANTNNVRADVVACDLTTTNSIFHSGSQLVGGYVQANNITNNFYPGGNLETNATESNAQFKTEIALTASNLECFVSANNLLFSTTLFFRKNAGNGNQTISIATITTGYFEDTTNTDVLVATDEINTQMITPVDVGDTITTTMIGWLGTIAAAATTTGHLLGSTGVGR